MESSRDRKKRLRYDEVQEAQEREIRRVLSQLRPEHLGGYTHGENTTDDIIRWQQENGFRDPTEFDGEIYPGLKRELYDAAVQSNKMRGTVRYGPNGEPGVEDLLTSDDWYERDKQQRRFAKTSQRLWRSYQLEHPNDSPEEVNTAVGLMIQYSGMSLDEIAALAEDENSRQQLFDRVHEAANASKNSRAYLPANDHDDRSAGLDLGGGSRGKGMPQDETETAISDDLTAWQRKHGLRY